eukprot:7390295-Prymnesium_polylepis.1
MVPAAPMAPMASMPQAVAPSTAPALRAPPPAARKAAPPAARKAALLADVEGLRQFGSRLEKMEPPETESPEELQPAELQMAGIFETLGERSESMHIKLAHEATKSTLELAALVELAEQAAKLSRRARLWPPAHAAGRLFKDALSALEPRANGTTPQATTQPLRASIGDL